MKKPLFSIVLLLLATCFQANVLMAARLDVFVSIPPQKWLCDQLGQEFITTHVLVDKGQEPHTFEPSPGQIRSLSQATLFFLVGLPFEREIVRRLEKGAPQLRIVNTTTGIARIPMEGKGHDHSGEGGEQGHHSDPSLLDPHVWLCPQNLKEMASAMATALSQEDPGHRDAYAKNLARLSQRLGGLDKTITARLAPYSGESFFVFHPAFGYFAHAYHLHQVAVETGGKSPTPRQLSVLIGKARAEKVKVIFVQPQFDPRSVEVVAQAIGGQVITLDPLGEDVAANLKRMADKIGEALKGQERK